MMSEFAPENCYADKDSHDENQSDKDLKESITIKYLRRRTDKPINIPEEREQKNMHFTICFRME